MERRRLQAADLFAQGRTRAEVAGELGVPAQTASRWHARWRGGGAAGMRTARHGKPARLGPAQLGKVRRVLDRGAVAAGFDNDLWTLARVATVIEQVTGVAHHPGHVWRILTAMRWSRQRPARKAIERDDAEIARWSPRSGRGLRKRPNAQSLALLRRRVGRQADPAGAPDLGAQGPHAGAAPPYRVASSRRRAAWWPTGPRMATPTQRPGWASTCWRAPTTPGSAPACWTAWATSR